METKSNIPASLQKQISDYRKTLFRSETILTLGAGISAILISFFFLFVSDRLWDTPKFIRLLAFAVGMVCLFFFWYRLGKNWLWRRRGVKQLASKIQAHHRELGDRLLGAIELAQGTHADENISEELKEAAIKKITEQASDINFNKDVDRKKPYRALTAMLVLISLIVLLFFLLPHATRNSILRWCNPIASITRFTFVVLEKKAPIEYVPKGEQDNISFKLAPESQWKPGKLSYSIGKVAKGTTDFSGNTATVPVEGLNEEEKLTVRAGDASESLTVKPIHRPSLVSLNSKVQYPAYTGREGTNSQMKGGTLSLLAGSKYSLEGMVSRKLKSASRTQGGTASKLQVSGAKFATSPEYAVKTIRGSFTWQDVFDFAPAAPYDFTIKIKKDREPFTECPTMAHFSAMLIDEALPIQIHSDDDFGVKKITAKYSYKPKNSAEISKKIDLATGATDKLKLKTEFLFSPKLLGLPEKNLVTFQPYAIDYYPDRSPVPSAPYKIYILSYEQHMKLLQERLERVMSDLEDMVRREENSLDKNKKISKMQDKKLQKKETTEKIREQQLREQAEKREVKKMVEEAMKLMKEALRNKKFPEKTIAQWIKFLDKMNNLSKQEMKDLVQNLKKATKNQGQPQRKKNMEEAVKNQQKMLNKLKKMLKKMDDSLQDLSLENFVNRLKKGAKKEQEIAASLKAMLKDIVGLPPKEISGPLKKQYMEQILKQRTVNTNAKNIQDDLIAFFARTRLKKYQKVTAEMDDFKMNDKLYQLQKSIDSNFTSRSIGQSNEMAVKFNEWAQMLAKANNKKSPQEQGKPQEIDPEFLLGLMRIIQGEQNLRQKTRYLDKNKPREAQEYKKQSKSLSADQGDLHVKLMFLQMKARSCPPAMKLLNRAGMIMDEVVTFLRKPQTNSPVIAAETEIIELLSGAFQQSFKQSGSSNAMLSMLMQMLMPQAGAGAGSTPGQSSMGGTTDAHNLQFNDPAFKKDDPERKGDKTQGTTHTEIPEEFKSDIEAYFKKRNQIKEK